MPEFLPIISTRYNSERVRLQSVVAPPYDVISREEQEAFYLKDAHNVIRLILNHDQDPYHSAADFFQKWLSEGILLRDKEPAFFVYNQTFRLSTGHDVTRSGVIGMMKLSPYSAGEVSPHERTMPGPKRDRLQLMGAVHANLSPIFGLIEDPTLLFDHTLEVATVNPALADIRETLASGEHVRHLLWKLDDPIAVDRIEKMLRDQVVTIADGHHRYETSLAFEEAHPEIQGDKYVMTYLSNLHGEGTVILPTHRVLHDVQGFDQYAFLEKLRTRFDLVLHESRTTAYQNLQDDPAAICIIEFEESPRVVLVRDLEPAHGSSLEKLPVVRLQEEILKPFVGLTQQAIDAKTNIFYPHTLEEVDAIRHSNAIQAIFLLRAVSPQEMVEIVKEGAFMPQKSTFFYPKLLSGLVFHEFRTQQMR